VGGRECFRPGALVRGDCRDLGDCGAAERHPALVLPAPSLVWESLVSHTRSGFLLIHLGVTLVEILLGFLGGSILGIGLGIGVALSPRLRGMLHPYLIASQAMPKLALAPIFVMWFGFGILPKILITALIAFFLCSRIR